jgi:hypothetical protein
MSPEPSVDLDYATLLRDGIVVWPGLPTPTGEKRIDRDTHVGDWRDQLVARAEADGLKEGRMSFHLDDVAFLPCVELFRPDGTPFPYKNDFPPPPQDLLAAEARPCAERAWGATLERARARLSTRS